MSRMRAASSARAWVAWAYLVAPVFLLSDGATLAPTQLPQLIAALVTTAFTTAALLVLAYHTVRQLRIVSQLHAAARTINLFQPRLTYAFSRLTASTALGVLVFLYFDFVVNPPTTETAALPCFALTAISVVLAVAAFLLPLLGLLAAIGLPVAIRLITIALERLLG
jgi:hypothetical protein